MTWTKWRKIADENNWYDDEFVNDGSACYELGIDDPDEDDIDPVYVGETENEKNRIKAYAQHGSHLSDIIDKHLEMGYTLYYRAQAKKSKKAAKKMQDNLLAEYDYDWNIQSNIDDED